MHKQSVSASNSVSERLGKRFREYHFPSLENFSAKIFPNSGSVLNLRNGGVVPLPNVLNFAGFLCSFHFPKVEKFRARTDSGIPYEEFLNYSGIIPEYSGIIPEFRNNETARAPWGVSGVVE
jgi:hypothetical protein